MPVVVAAKALPVGALVGPGDVKIGGMASEEPVDGRVREGGRGGGARTAGPGSRERADHDGETGGEGSRVPAWRRRSRLGCGRSRSK